MTAKEYLISQLKDDCAEPNSVQTRKGLAGYAIKLHKGVKGYSISDAESIMRLCGCGDIFIEKCSRYISESDDFMNMAEQIPFVLDD